MIPIFISYGHSKYSDLADRLYKSLSAVRDENGNPKYEVIKDNEGYEKLFLYGKKIKTADTAPM